MKIYLLILAAVALTTLSACDPNSKPIYAESGFPSNCRALIAEAIDGWRANRYTPPESLESIDRNCGRNGHLWGL